MHQRTYTPKQAITGFLTVREKKVKEAERRVREAEEELEKARKGVEHADRFWYGPEGLIWLCKQNDLDPYALLQMGVEVDDRFRVAHAELMAVANADEQHSTAPTALVAK
jgi:hypothetical protein